MLLPNRLFALVLLALALLGGALLSAGPAAAEGYVVEDIGTLGGFESWANAINNAGQIAGSSIDSEGIERAFLYDDGVMSNLGELPGIPCGYANCGTIAFGINDSGQVVGRVSTGYYRALLWQSGAVVDLSAQLESLYTDSLAFDVNNLGQIVGRAGSRAAMWQSGTAYNLGTLGGMHSEAYGINDSGQVVGWATATNGGEFIAFLWQSGAMANLGTLGGYRSDAHGINGSGQVVGMLAYYDGVNVWMRAFRYAGGVISDIGTLGGQGSVAKGINAHGHIVGSAQTAAGDWHAFLWMNGVMLNLNDLAAASEWDQLVEARAINDRGQIVGYGYRNGDRRAFLLTPACTMPAPAGIASIDTQQAVTGTVRWGASYLPLQGQPVSGVRLQAGCVTAQTNDEGRYSMIVERGAQTFDVRLKLFEHKWGDVVWAAATITETLQATVDANTRTLPELDAFGRFVQLDLLGQTVRMETAFTSEGFTGQARLMFSDAADATPLIVNARYRNDTRELTVTGDQGSTFSWGPQQVTLEHLSFRASPASASLVFTGTATLDLGGLSLQSEVEGRLGATGEVELATRGTAEVGGVEVTFDRITVQRDRFVVAGHSALPNQPSDVTTTFTATVTLEAATLELGLDNFVFDGITTTTTLRYTTNPSELKVVGTGRARVGDSVVDVTIDSVINPFVSNVRARAAIDLNSTSSLVSLDYNARTGELSGRGSLAFLIKPCPADRQGNAPIYPLSVGIEAGRERIRLALNAAIPLSCAAGATAYVSVSYDGRLADAQARIPFTVEGRPVDLALAVRGDQNLFQVMLGFGFHFGGSTGNGQSIETTTTPAVRMLLTDSLGRRVGYDPASGQIVNEVPGATYHGLAGGVDEITAPAYLGGYLVTLSSTGDAAVTIRATDDGGRGTSFTTALPAGGSLSLVGGSVLDGAGSPQLNVGDLPVVGLAIAPATPGSAAPGWPVYHTLWLSNTGNVSDTFDLSFSGFEWSSTGTTEIGPVAGGSAAAFAVTVTVPYTAEIGSADRVTVTATSRLNPSIAASAVATTTAVDVYGVFLYPPSDGGSGDAGAPVVYGLLLANIGTRADLLRMSAGGNRWPVDLPAALTLDSYDSTLVSVTVTIPARVVAGAVDVVTITATSSADPSQWDITVLTTTASSGPAPWPQSAVLWPVVKSAESGDPSATLWESVFAAIAGLFAR